MRNFRPSRCALACCSLLLAASASASSYTFQTLNNPGDPAFNQLLGINNSGTIVGYFGDGTLVPNNGYTLSNGAYSAQNFPGAVQTQVVGINSIGTTAGFYINSLGQNLGFVKIGNTFQSVSDPNTPASAASVNQLLGVNASGVAGNGVAAGFYLDSNGNAHAYTFNTATSTFTPITLPTSFNAVSVTATGIDNAGVISGFYTDTAGATHGFVDNAGAFTSINDPAGTNTIVFGLNNNLQLVGSFTDTNGITQGFIDNLATNSFQTITDPNASSTAAFNVNGTTINGINDQGSLVGFYSNGVSVNGFLATTPVPEPSTWLLLATGGLGLARTLRGRRRFGL